MRGRRNVTDGAANMEKALKEVVKTGESLGLGRGRSMEKSKDAMKASSNGR
jgi:hypothetical protein